MEQVRAIVGSDWIVPSQRDSVMCLPVVMGGSGGLFHPSHQEMVPTDFETNSRQNVGRGDNQSFISCYF